MSTRAVTLVGSLMAGVVWIGLLTLVLELVEHEGTAGRMLLDWDSDYYPFTIQNVMWIVFFVAAGELVVRQAAGNSEEDQLRLRLLPEDAQTVLRQQDLGPIYRRVQQSDPEQQHWLQRLLASALRQFQVSGSVDQVNAMFDSSMELYQHEIDLRYNVLRYLVWLIPTLGFIGTVVGIAAALETAGENFENIDPNANMAQLGPTMMSGLTGQLGVAFYTTLLALLQSAGLMFAMHMVQGREESALNRVGQYCLKNLVNRLYEV